MQSSVNIGPIQQTTLADQVCDRLRRAIILGQLQPGERLSETALAEQLGVSRSPVREALQRLQLERLVAGQTNRSCIVWQPTEQDVKEIISLRVMIESLAAEWCIDRLTEEDFQQLHVLIDREQQAIIERDFITLIQEDKNFHEYICMRANHYRLLEWWQQISSQWQVLIYRRLQTDPEGIMPSVIQDHENILSALQCKDLSGVIMLHREINVRVIKSTAAALTR